jgi:hypothetical protein
VRGFPVLRFANTGYKSLHSRQAKGFSYRYRDPFGQRKRVFLRCLEALAPIFALVYALTGFPALLSTNGSGFDNNEKKP